MDERDGWMILRNGFEMTAARAATAAAEGGGDGGDGGRGGGGGVKGGGVKGGGGGHRPIGIGVFPSAARFNHSCDPNCYTKIINVEGRKRITIYSKVRTRIHNCPQNFHLVHHLYIFTF